MAVSGVGRKILSTCPKITTHPAPRARGLLGIPGRAAAITLRPISGAVGRAAAAGVEAERRTVDWVLQSPELERALNAAVDSVRIQASLERAVDSEGVKRLVDRLFDSGLLDQVIARMFETGLIDRVVAQMFDAGVIDRLLERLLASEGLWHMIDEIAGSPVRDRRDLAAGFGLRRPGHRRGAGPVAEGR